MTGLSEEEFKFQKIKEDRLCGSKYPNIITSKAVTDNSAKEEIYCPYCGAQNKHPKDKSGAELDDKNFIMGCDECSKYFSVNCRRDCSIYITQIPKGGYGVNARHEKEIETLREEILKLEEVISKWEKHNKEKKLLCHICGKDH